MPTQRKRVTTKKSNPPLVSIIMGSDSDWLIMKSAAETLKEFSVHFEQKIVSAHRTPREMLSFASDVRKRGIRVIIAGAGGAAHLPGMVAAITELPVIGVPVMPPPQSTSNHPSLYVQGIDALLSMAQMPKGVPVATVGISQAVNAALLAIQIIASGGKQQDQALLDKLKLYKERSRQEVLSKKIDTI